LLFIWGDWSFNHLSHTSSLVTGYLNTSVLDKLVDVIGAKGPVPVNPNKSFGGFLFFWHYKGLNSGPMLSRAMHLSHVSSLFWLLVVFWKGSSVSVQGWPWTTILFYMPTTQLGPSVYTSVLGLLVQMGSH
jgi:hypothetical protein